jgi:pimeloyl-ACP methyl ester carboxylesterase
VTTSVVLVHGAWHGAWCFERVLPLLAAAGIPALAIDLPGHGDDPGPLLDLHGDAARVREVLDGLDGDCVLLGHSYGGAVITEAGNHPAVRHLVYLCAFALDEGETCVEAATAAAQATGFDFATHTGPNLAEAIVAGDDGNTTIAPDLASACLYNDCDPATAAQAVARLGPQPAVTLVDVPTNQAWRERPSTYVVCTEDLAVPPDIQRVMAQRCTTTVEWPASHSPFLSMPERFVSLLSDLVAAP